MIGGRTGVTVDDVASIMKFSFVFMSNPYFDTFGHSGFNEIRALILSLE